MIFCSVSSCPDRKDNTETQEAEVPRAVIITPIWANQPWYPLILENLVDFPIHLPGSPDLLWKKWSCWCTQRGIDPFPDSMTTVVEFLTSQFQEGKQYSTMNSYRSTLSATLLPMESHPVGQHPCLYVDCCRECLTKDHQPHSVWSVETVLFFIKQSMKDLSRKMVVLLALSITSRASDLTALDMRFRQFSPEGVLFRIPGLTKTRHSGPPREVFFSLNLKRNLFAL